MSVNWCTCGDHWCDLMRLKLDDNFDDLGVYIIWHDGNREKGIKPRVVRVGSGNLKDRLSSHRKDREIIQYRKRGVLRVTWVKLFLDEHRLGVERYLGDTLDPLVGENFPAVDPIPVPPPTIL